MVSLLFPGRELYSIYVSIKFAASILQQINEIIRNALSLIENIFLWPESYGNNEHSI